MSSKLLSTLYEVWGEPFLTKVGLLPNRNTHDFTFSRYKIPLSSMEKRLHANEDLEVWFGTCKDEDGNFHWYQVWEDKKVRGRFVEGKGFEGRKGDLLFIHGTGVHGGTFAVSREF